MEFSEILPVEMSFSTGWTDEFVLPNEQITDLHDCMELAVSDGYLQSGGCSSPETEVSIENVTSWLEDIDVPDNDIYSILNNEMFYDSLGDGKFSKSIDNYQAVTNTVSLVSEVVPTVERVIVNKDSTRRKQRIVPICNTIVDSGFTHALGDVYSHHSVQLSQGDFYLKDEAELFDIVSKTSPTSSISDGQVARSQKSDECLVKEEPKVRRKRGLSHYEKRDRKKESNRNASFRYRQRKKMQKDAFVQYSLALNEQLQTVKKEYHHTAEELIRYIKHANLIRTVKDECQLLLK